MRNAEHQADVYDTGYWVCLAFQSREQCDEFCEALGFDPDLYLNGNEVAEAIGVMLKANGVEFPAGKTGLARALVEELAEPLPKR